MKNKLADLTDHLFAQIERLGEEGLGADDLRTEIQRSMAMTSIAREIVSVGNLALAATKIAHDIGPTARLPDILGIGHDKH